MGQLIFVVFSASGGGGGGVTTFEGRAGAVVGVAGDYTSTEITNASTVVGATVTDALDTLNTGLGGLGLQEAYDNGPTIVTGAGGGVVIDDVSFQDAVITAAEGEAFFIRTFPSAVAVGSLNIIGGVGAGIGVPGGLVSVLGGDGYLGSDGGILMLAGGVGSAVTGAGEIGGAGGSVDLASGDGGDAGAAAAAGGIAGTLLIRTGAGGDADGVGNIAGNGGELNIGAGAAGTPLGGATPGVGGALSLTAGTGGDGTGGEVQLGSGNGVIASGNLTISVGSSGGVVGLLNILGGAAAGTGSGQGGTVQIDGGPAAVGEDQDGGPVNITGGAGDGIGGGGDTLVAGGPTDTGPGGDVDVIGGDGGGGALDLGGAGGRARLQGGQSSQPNQDGGAAVVAGGSATSGVGGGTGGAVDIIAGSAAGVGNAAGSVLIRSGLEGTVPTGTVQVALNAGSGNAAAVVGGWFLDSANGRLSLRNYSPAGTPTGSLKVHELDEAGEALQSPAQQGLIHFQTEQSAGIATTVGFRASKSGDYGLVARVYQRTIDASGTYVVVHNLDCNAPVVAVYNAAGLAVVPTSITQNTLDQVTVVAVVAGGGILTVVGF